MSINIKKYTKGQMAKMVEDAQEKSAALEAEVVELKNCIDAKNDLLADTEASLGRANAELTYSVAEKNALRNDVTKMVGRAALECGRTAYAETHPWRNLWAWLKRKLVRE